MEMQASIRDNIHNKFKRFGDAGLAGTFSYVTHFLQYSALVSERICRFNLALTFDVALQLILSTNFLLHALQLSELYVVVVLVINISKQGCAANRP